MREKTVTGRGGAALVELVIAMLLMAAVVASLFGSFVTIQLSARKSQAQQLAALALSSLSNALKNYVTSDPSNNTLCSAPGHGANCSPKGSWQLPGDTCSCWALQDGVTHIATSFLPADLQGVPYNGTITYTVLVLPSGARQVTVKTHLDDVQ